MGLYATEADLDAAHELELFIENDGDLYRQMTRPIIENLKKKHKKGTYDPRLAVKAWRHLADEGAKRYVKEFGGSGQKWYEMFDVATRDEVARQLMRGYLDEVTDKYPTKKPALKGRSDLGSSRGAGRFYYLMFRGQAPEGVVHGARFNSFKDAKAAAARHPEGAVVAIVVNTGRMDAPLYFTNPDGSPAAEVPPEGTQRSHPRPQDEVTYRGYRLRSWGGDVMIIDPKGVQVGQQSGEDLDKARHTVDALLGPQRQIRRHSSDDGKRLTYGVLPSLKVFEEAWADKVGEDKTYRIRLGRTDSRAADGTSIGDGEFTVDELYDGIEELIDKGTDASLDLASGILSTLGFEWI